MANFDPSFARFVFFIFIVFLVGYARRCSAWRSRRTHCPTSCPVFRSITFNSFFRVIAVVSPSMDLSQAASAPVSGLVVMFAGFLGACPSSRCIPHSRKLLLDLLMS